MKMLLLDSAGAEAGRGLPSAAVNQPEMESTGLCLNGRHQGLHDGGFSTHSRDWGKSTGESFPDLPQRERSCPSCRKLYWIQHMGSCELGQQEKSPWATSSCTCAASLCAGHPGIKQMPRGLEQCMWSGAMAALL